MMPVTEIRLSGTVTVDGLDYPIKVSKFRAYLADQYMLEEELAESEDGHFVDGDLQIGPQREGPEGLDEVSAVMDALLEAAKAMILATQGWTPDEVAS